MQAKVYVYGLRPPTHEAERVAEQLHLAHRYRNDLVAIERKRRERVAALLSASGLSAHEERLEAAEQVLEAALSSLRAVRQAACKRAETSEQREAVKAARADVKAFREQLKEERKQLRPTLSAETETINDGAADERRAARAVCGVYWGTYLLIEQADEQARKSPTPPQFQRWTGEGAVGVQLQGGLDTDTVFGADTRLQIDPVPPTAWDRRRSPERRTRVRLRVGSDGRAPIWAEWPVTLHRPLPTGEIVWAKVLRQRVEAKSEWGLHLTIRVEDPTPTARSGAVGVDLGWRLREDGLRSGYWVGSDGEHGEILVDQRTLDRLQKVKSLCSIRDRNLDELRPWLAEWLRARRAGLPEWLRERTQYLHTWKAPRKFNALSVAWRAQRFPGDGEAVERLEAWRKQDKHLWTWETHQRERTLRCRREGYRLLAATLAERYGVLVLEDLDLRVFQQRRPAEAEQGECQPARSQQPVAATSILRSCLINAFEAVGGRVVKLDPAGTTKECWLCGGTAWSVQAEESVDRTCRECAALVDQDENAGRVLLARFERSGGIAGSADPDTSKSGQLRVSGGRWQRRKERCSKSGTQDCTA